MVADEKEPDLVSTGGVRWGKGGTYIPPAQSASSDTIRSLRCGT